MGRELGTLSEKNMERTEGALGGSVMAGYDEDEKFSWLLEGCEWGILDSEHKPKLNIII